MSEKEDLSSKVSDRIVDTALPMSQNTWLLILVRSLANYVMEDRSLNLSGPQVSHLSIVCVGGSC